MFTLLNNLIYLPRYYNNIATLKELYKLRHNTLLEEVDLRLNPVTKNEPDYRLFMVHMLPNLRKLGKFDSEHPCILICNITLFELDISDSEPEA